MLVRQSEEELSILLKRGYRYALSLIHDESRAEDLLQDAWLSVVRAGGSFSFAYLRSAIRSRFIDGIRRIHLMPVLDENMEDNSPDSDDGVHFTADRMDIEKMLEVIRPEEREVLYLSLVEGYTAQEIGEITDKPRGTVLTLAYRGKAKMRQVLSDAPLRRHA